MGLKRRRNVVRFIVRLMICLGLVGALSGCGKQVSEPVDLGWRPSEEQLAQVTPESGREYREIGVGGQKLRVELADTPEKMSTGLSYREEIGSDGMLFVLPRKVTASFWMKGMMMDLDLIWIDCGGVENDWRGEEECKVVDISREAVAPENPDGDDLMIYSPIVPVTHVLEVVGGWSGENGVEVGSVFEL